MDQKFIKWTKKVTKTNLLMKKKLKNDNIAHIFLFVLSNLILVKPQKNITSSAVPPSPFRSALAQEDMLQYFGISPSRCLRSLVCMLGIGVVSSTGRSSSRYREGTSFHRHPHEHRILPPMAIDSRFHQACSTSSPWTCTWLCVLIYQFVKP